MAIAKVILNGVTQMDVTGKTVTAGSMLSGVTALKNDGTDITGSIASKTSSDLTVSGATVTAPAGYYASAASKSVASGSATTPATTITANPTVSVNSSGLITATVSKTQNVTPSVSAGYVSSGTAGTITVSGSGTSQLTTQAAQTIHPSTTDQTIASGKYLTGAQTIKAVTTTNLTAANIVQGVTVKIGDSTDDDCVASVTGTAATGGNDFIITLTENASTYIYEPDCTFAEALSAYQSGKTIAFISDGSPCIYYYDSENGAFMYGVLSSYGASNWQAVGYKIYMWTNTGVTLVEDPEQSGSLAYLTNNATAVPADVASGKVFYNANGYQVGTASGGGGSDADYIGMIERTTAATSLPSTITKIGDYAFRGCSNLALTSLPSGVTSIGKYAFDGCGSLALTALPSGITATTIYEGSFQGCSSMTLSAIPSSVTRIETYAFSDCYQITVSVIPNTVTYIGMYAFARCENITSISCGGRVTILSAYAFNGNTSHPMKLVRASFPNSAINNLPNVFGATTAANACQLLENADIGKTPSIAANAFANCYKLQTLILRKSDAICTLANVSAFLNTPMRGYNSLSGTIYVPSALISTYQAATNWSTIYGEGYVTFAAIEGSQYEL